MHSINMDNGAVLSNNGAVLSDGTVLMMMVFVLSDNGALWWSTRDWA